MSDYIKICQTCDHYPNDKHCIGCEWDKTTGVNTKWENKPIIDRKVIEDIKAEIDEYKDDKVIHAERNEMVDIVLQIIDKHCGKENE